MKTKLNYDRIREIAEEIHCNSGLFTQPLTKELLKVALEVAALFDRKQADYGSSNMKAFGELGVLVRCNDKVERLKTLYQNRRKPKNESVEDSWLDLADYGMIAVLIRRGLWK